MNPLLEAALSYAKRGWCIIPIGSNKKPAVPKWTPYQSQRPSDDDFLGWFDGRKSVTGLAVICGEVSGGLVCRDFDEPEAYESWARSNTELAEILPTVRTGRGYHVYFVSKHRRINKDCDGELRGGGYCLLPPSKHPSGCHYEWVIQLPEGQLPVIDPFSCGLFPRGQNSASPALLGAAPGTERTEKTENKEEIRESENAEQLNGSPLSALSVIEKSQEIAPEIEAAIAATLPGSPGLRNSLVFELARALKAIPSLAEIDAESLRPIVREWHRHAYPTINTKEFDDTWTDFKYAWARVRFPRGSNSLELALRRADAAVLPACAAQYENESTHRLIKLCRELSKDAAQGVFYLGSRTAGELFGIDHNVAWKRLRMLEQDGVLECVVRGKSPRATRYRYKGD